MTPDIPPPTPDEQAKAMAAPTTGALVLNWHTSGQLAPFWTCLACHQTGDVETMADLIDAADTHLHACHYRRA